MEPRILIEDPEIPPDFVKSTITSFGDKRVETINQRVMTSENLLSIIKRYDLYPDDQRTKPRETILERMRADLGMEIVSADVVDTSSGRAMKATIAFRVWYESRLADRAYRVANELTTLYLNENLSNRTELAQQTSKFLLDEGTRLATQVRDLETQLAAFKDSNQGALPELVQMNLQFIDRADRDIDDAKRRTQALDERRVFLEGQLAALEPSMNMYDESGQRVPGGADQLRILQNRLVALEARYSPTHPDVVRLREEISGLGESLQDGANRGELGRDLTKQRSALAELRKKYSDEHPEVRILKDVVAGMENALQHNNGSPSATAPRNPIYVELQSQLQSVKLEQQAAGQQVAQLQAKISDYQSRVTRAPQIERQYADLSRDYENARVKYAEIKAKQLEAQISESMEASHKGERFTLIEPPLMPERPTSPNRPLILGFGLLLAALLGIGAAFATEAVDPRIYGSSGLAALLDIQPLAVIPLVATKAELRMRRRVWQFASVGVVAALLIGLTLLHFLVVPLDVLWYALLRRFEVMS